MTYTRAYTTWQDKPNLTTPVNAAILQNMEQGIYDAFVYHTNQNMRYVAGTGVTGVTGSDSNDGLHPGKPKATVQASYDSLPAAGGHLILLNGTHDLGTGFVGAARKPVVMMSLTGKSPWVTTVGDAGVTGGLNQVMPVLVGTGANVIKVVGDVSNIANGWAFLGLGFDLRNVNVTSGILVEDTNHVHVKDCNVHGRGSASQVFLRSTHPNHDDVSWWRIENNLCYSAVLCHLNDGGSGNCNNNQIFHNVVFGPGGFGIIAETMQRSLILGNNIEGDATSSGIRLMGSSHNNYIFGNGGENLITPFMQFDSGAYGNIHFNYGSSNTGPVKLLDLDAANIFAAGNYALAQTASGMATLTADFTLTAANWWGQMLNMNKATAISLTFPLQANVGIPIGSSGSVRQGGAGQVTIVPQTGAVVIRSKGGGLKTSAQYGVINWRKVDVNEWAAWGDTTT